jgi:four helix bundle protein
MNRGSFRDLKIWKKGYELLLEVYKLARRFPPEEKFALTSQIKRSANSVIAQIAEAHGRYHFADKCRVLFQSRGECEETQSHLSVALGLGYILKKEFDKLDKEYEGLGVGINYYILALKNSKT